MVKRMSDLDSMTDKEVANDLSKLNIKLSKAGYLHAVEDAVMIQAVKRLNESYERRVESHARGLEGLVL